MFLCVASAPQPACADVSQKDFEVILRAIGFVRLPPGGDKTFAIVYDPANSASFREAQQMQEKFGVGIASNDMTLRGRLVPASNLELLQGSSFALVTSGLQPWYRKISDLARAGHIVSFSLDRSCVEQQYCLVYINTEGRVEIVVNQSVAQESKIEFKPVFLMMVTVL